MNDTRLEELKEKYKNRNLLEELAWGTYANHSGYTSKQNGEFLNWLCNMAYRTINDTKPIKSEWIVKSQKTRILHSNEVFECKKCGHERSRYVGEILKYCPNCGVKMVESEVEE